MKLPFFITLLFLILFSLEIIAQDDLKWTIRGGIDKKTSWKIGARYQENQSQFGLSFWPGVGKKSRLSNSTSIQFDYIYHFAGNSPLSTRRPWFAKNAITYQIAPNTNYKTHTWYYYLHLGREFNFSPKFGIYGDLGLDTRLSENYKKKTPDAWPPDDIPSPFSVGFEIGAFFRFK